MTEAGWLILAMTSTLLSMGWLALSYESHWRQVFSDNTLNPNPFRLKLIGWSFLLLSIVFCLTADHPSMAVLVWIMLLAVAAMTIAMTLSQRPSVLRRICPPFCITKA